MSRVFILNGPPACGKDTVGREFAGRMGFESMSFKHPLFRIAATTMGMSLDEFIQCYEDREWKETPQDCLNGHTVRELLIQISETYVKPFFGNDWFGRQALESINGRPWAEAFVFTDGGFVDELETIANAGHEVLLVHMYRDGCDFSNDSRSYVLSNQIPRIYTLNNNGTVDEAVSNLERILDEIYDRNNVPADERELLDSDAPIPRPRRARPMELARAYGAGTDTIRATSDGGVEPEEPRTGLDFETIIANAERRQRQREADRQRRSAESAAAATQLTPEELAQAEEAGRAYITRRAQRQRADGSVGSTYQWTTSYSGSIEAAPASAATIVDESEIMSEG